MMTLRLEQVATSGKMLRGNANDRKSYSTDKKKPHVAMKMKELQYLISIWLNPKNRFKIYQKKMV